MEKNYVIAVFDVGKTNKKIILYDAALRVVASVDRRFETVPDTSLTGVPIPTEPVGAIEEWFLDTIAGLAKEHEIRAIAVATHGATIVTVGDDGRPALPVVDYTYEPGDEFQTSFYETFGSPDDLQRTTATPALGALINPAKGLFFLKNADPNRFARIRHVLMYPQYFGYRLTGVAAAEKTYAGCHTYLWNHLRSTWSSVAEDLGILAALPKSAHTPWEVLGPITPEVAARTGLGSDTVVTYGIHDSNASLLPYIVARPDQDFVLNSTGTWCVAMRPTDTVAFAPEEIGTSVFFNISASDTPVKTAVLMGGLEFDAYRAIISDINKSDELPDFNESLYARIVREASMFVVPGLVRGSGQFPKALPRVVVGDEVYPFDEIRSGARVPDILHDPAVAYAVLNLSIAIQTRVALRRVGTTDTTAIFTEGGFRSNFDYNALISALFPGSPVWLTGLEQATSFGAALTAVAAVEGTRPTADMVNLAPNAVRRHTFEGLERYAERFEQLAKEESFS